MVEKLEPITFCANGHEIVTTSGRTLLTAIWARQSSSTNREQFIMAVAVLYQPQPMDL